MSYRLVVTGADSATLRDKFSSNPIPTLTDLTWEQADNLKENRIDFWTREGFHRTPAGIYRRGSEWRRVAIHEELEKA